MNAGPGDIADHRRRALAVMDTGKAWPEDSPWLRDAVEDLPRDAFAPDTVWTWDGHAWQPISRARDPQAWARLVHAGPDDATITEITDGVPSSSLSCTSIVVDMLDSLDLEPGHRVLELGTGTGWNAALIAHRSDPTDTARPTSPVCWASSSSAGSPSRPRPRTSLPPHKPGPRVQPPA
ncbi:hypothetical protein ACFXMF_38720, partial [Embleya sp. NPDC059213]